MKQPIIIPALGESVAEATISRIIKKSGSLVMIDEEIVELETDKVNQVLFAVASGLLELTIQEGQTVKVNDTIGWIDTSKAPSAQHLTPTPKQSTPSEPLTAEPLTAEPLATEQPSAEPPKISPPPVANKEAIRQSEEAWLEKRDSQGTEGHGVRKEEHKPPQRIKMTKLRKTIAERLLEAKNTTAMLTTFNEVDMSQAMEIRAKEQEQFTKKYGVKLGLMSFFVKATVSALKAFPEINAYIDGDEIVRLNTFDIGVAVSTEKGLVVPVIRNCDRLSFGEIEKEIEQYAKAARSSTLKIEDLRGGSFTITNGGRFGSLFSTPILNIPQSAILGMHSIVKRPVVVGEQIIIRPMMYLALSYDHRLVDGREAVLFLVHLKEHIEDPSKIMLDL